MIVLDEELTVVTANEAFLATFEQTRDALLGRPLGEIDGGAWHGPDLLELLHTVLPREKRIDDTELSLASGAVGQCALTLSALELLQAPNMPRLVLLTVTDIRKDA